MFFPLSQHFSSSSFFSTTWILSQQRISTLSCLLAMLLLLLLLWYDCYVFVCLFFFCSVWMWVLFAALFSLAIYVRNGAPTTRNLSLFLLQCRCFRLLSVASNAEKCDSIFWFCFFFFNLLSIQYLNLILLSFVWAFVRVDGGVCGNAWLLTVTGEYVWVSLFVLFVDVCVSCCLDIQEKFMNEFFFVKQTMKERIWFYYFFLSLFSLVDK